MRFQRRWWRVERIGWAVMLGLVGAALAGLFGSGPLSSTTSTSPLGAEVAYQRFQRRSALSELRVRLPAGDGALAALSLSPGLAEGFEIERITPAPVRAATDAAGLHLTLRRTAGRPGVAYLKLRPRRAGHVKGSLHVAGEALPVRVMVYP